MKTYGLIGYPLSHSFSKKFFTEFFEMNNIADCRYLNYAIEDIGELRNIINSEPGLTGLNVTIPYKEQVIPYLDETDTVAARIGAVNTIKIIRKNQDIHLRGFNTDAYGFYHSIRDALKKKHNSALILGTGGASKAIAYVFDELGISYVYVSRTPKVKNQIGYPDLCGPVLYNFQIIVNTSPVGMYPNTDTSPDIAYEFIGKDHILYDLVYNPSETLFLKKGRERGATTINGLKMLHLQAEKAWEIWNE